MPRVDYLLTGATGFLGSVIQQRLAQYSILSLNRSVCDLAMAVPELSAQPRTVIHAAGKAHTVARNEAEASDFFRTNVTGTKNLIQSLGHLLPENFVFISTVAVYGREEGELIDETHPLMGSTPYAKSKIEAEGILSDWCTSHNVRLTILRLPLIVGKNPPGNLGTMMRWMKKGLYLGVGSGAAKKSMVLASDVADFVPKIESVGGIYNLTDGHHPSLSELEEAMAKSLGKGIPYRLPVGMLKAVARIGDLLGPNFPLTSSKLNKLNSSLTFSDLRARKEKLWQPTNVLASRNNLFL